MSRGKYWFPAMKVRLFKSKGSKKAGIRNGLMLRIPAIRRAFLKAHYPQQCNCDASVRFEVQVPRAVAYKFEDSQRPAGISRFRTLRGIWELTPPAATSALRR